MAVLVGFATSGGSSRGVAERLASRLSVDGITAETRPVSEVPEVAGYDAVVLGSAIHGGKWLRRRAGSRGRTRRHCGSDRPGSSA